MNPPSKRGHFLLGNMLAVQRNPTDFLLKLRSEYGDLARYPVAIWKDIYLFSHPAAVRHVLVTNQKNYSVMLRSRMMLKPIMGNGLLTNEGPSWLLSRRLMQPAFHHKFVAHFAELILRITNSTLGSWHDYAKRGEPLDIKEQMNSLTLEIVAKALFGSELEIETFSQAWATLQDSIVKRISSPWLPLLGVVAPKNRQFRQRTRVLHQMVSQVISKRRQIPHSDWLSELAERLDTHELAHTNQLRDEVMTLLIAGHETTTMLLTWAFYLVSTHPDVYCKLTQEIAIVLAGRQPEAEDLMKLPYSLKVLQEAMRLYPPVWVMFRKALADDVVLGYQIPKGARVTLSPFVTHRHPDYWSEPTRFNPDRTQVPTAYFPFGYGARQCIGQHFALLTAQLVLIMVTQRYQLQLTKNFKPTFNHQITLQPKESICMIPLQAPKNGRKG